MSFARLAALMTIFTYQMVAVIVSKIMNLLMINVWIFVVMVLLLLHLVMMVIISMEMDALPNAKFNMDMAATWRSINSLAAVCTKEDQFNLNWIVFINIRNLILQRLY